MKELLIKNKIFLFFYWLMSIGVLFLLLFYDKKEGHLMLTSFHNKYLDIFFSNITHLGDGIFVLLTGFLLLLKRVRYGLLIIISNALSGLFIQLLKNTIFDDFDRPLEYFDDPSVLHQVAGVNIHVYNSFPSGHATSAFALFFGISLLTENTFLKFILLIIASIVAYSRVYISQHFLVDIWAGSATGMAFSFVTWLILKNSQKKFLNKSLFKL